MSRGHLLGLLLVFGVLAAVYSFTTPIFEAPDEPWHYAYVRWLAEGHGLPRLDDDSSGANQEVAQPPLYYAAAALINSPFADDDLPELFWHNPQFGYQAGGTVNDNKNMLIHTDREHFPWRGAVLAIRIARLVSLAFGLLTVAATYGLARETLPDRPMLATLAAAVVAFTPQFLFISGVVSNDSAIAAVCTCALWALARIIRLGLTPRRAVLAGLVLGLALLSKTSALLLLPLALLAVCRFVDWRMCKRRETVLMLCLAAVLGGWWFLRNWILFDDPLGLSVHTNTLWGRPESASLTGVLSELPQVFRSFWGAFGWGHVELPVSLYIVFGALIGLSLFGWIRLLARLGTWAWAGSDSAFALAGTPRWRAVSATAAIYLLAASWCLAVLVALLRWMQQVEAPHGRLLFPALGAWALLLAVGWLNLGLSRDSLSSARYPSRLKRYLSHLTPHLPLFPVGIMFLLALIIPFAIIRPAFAFPRLLSPEQASREVLPQSLVYAEQARLLGYRVQPESVTAGDWVEVTLCWEALRAIDQDYTLFIHLLGRDNSRVGERTTYPGQGRFPTSLWPTCSSEPPASQPSAGAQDVIECQGERRAFCDSYHLQVAPWAPAPELYALEVGLYDAETGWRLPAFDAAGQLVEPPTVGLVRVAPATAPPPPEHTLTYDFGGQIALVGYDDSATLRSAETLSLTLYWQALQVPQGDYKVFVHLLDETGALVIQNDAPPREGRYPTWAWQPGDLVPDIHQVMLPDERPPGPYHWLVGLYRPDTRERLPVVGPEGPLPDAAISLGEDQD